MGRAVLRHVPARWHMALRDYAGVRLPRKARAIQSKMTLPINATRMLHTFNPVTPTFPNKLKTQPPRIAPTMPTMIHAIQSVCL